MTARGEERAVLCIVDDPATTRLLERVVARARLRVIAVRQGSLGLELAREHAPALVVVALDLVDLAGESVLRRLGVDPETAAIPVIVLSEDEDARLRRRMLRAGARDVFALPLDVAAFEAVLATFAPPRGDEHPAG